MILKFNRYDRFLIQRFIFISTKNNCSNDDKLSSFKDQLENGPNFQDFIAGVVPRNVEHFSHYSGKLKREPDEEERHSLLIIFYH